MCHKQRQQKAVNQAKNCVAIKNQKKDGGKKKSK